VYTLYGYAQVDLEKYKDELNGSNSASTSPDKHAKEDQDSTKDNAVNHDG
jgi:hypothetical protein